MNEWEDSLLMGSAAKMEDAVCKQKIVEIKRSLVDGNAILSENW